MGLRLSRRSVHFSISLGGILWFDPRREHSSRPHIFLAVARSGDQGRRFFSAAEGLSLTDASTAAPYDRRAAV
jgi:hypothetical protein